MNEAGPPSTITRPQHCAVLIVLLCLLPILFSALFLAEPFERDEGVYATIAQGVLDGDLPYRDYYEIKPPLIYGWYAASFFLIGETVAAPRALAAICLVLAAAGVYVASFFLQGPRTARYAAALFSFSTACAYLQINANTEVFMLPAMVWSLALFVIATRQRSHAARLLFLAGILAGVAIMTKQVAIWNLIALLAGLMWTVSALSPGRRLASGGVLLTGAALACGGALLPFVLSRSLGDFYEISLRDAWLYVQNVSLISRLSGFGRLALELLATLPFVVAAAVGAWRLLPPHRPQAFLILAWSIACFLGVSSGGRFFPHYFVQALPALALLGAPVVLRLHRRLQVASLRPAWAVGATAVLLPCLVLNLNIYLRQNPESRHLAKYPDAQAMAAIEARDLGRYINETTRPGDTILNWGREAQIYFYAKRKPATRYLADWSFWDAPPTLGRAMADLNANPPALIVDSLPPPGLQESWSKYHPQAYVDLLNREYDHVGRMHFAEVYRRKPKPDAGPEPVIPPSLPVEEQDGEGPIIDIDL